MNATAANALLALEDGSLFWGSSIGAERSSVGEVIFNTAICGYQEILSDPSYARQIITLTHPHIGNVGTNTDDLECDTTHAAGLVIRHYSHLVSNWRSQQDLREFLKHRNIVGICDIDTRKLTRLIRSGGAQNGCIVAGTAIDPDAAIKQAREFAGLKGMDLAKVVTTDKPYEWDQGEVDIFNASINDLPDNDSDFSVIAYDFGVKKNILRMLVERGCRVTVVPAETTMEDLQHLEYDGVFLSNGPGDPEPCTYAISTIRQFLEKRVPVFGICLGHQLLALAAGARTVKMKFGHHGANHPVKNLNTGEIMITSQNHGFAVDDQNLPDSVVVTHRSLFDDTIQGIELQNCPAYSFQGHPEASPGPHDANHLFSKFLELMRTHRRNKSNAEAN